MSKRLKSERMVLQSSMSFTGAAKRIWHMTDTDNLALKVVTILVSIVLIIMAWSGIFVWYCMFGFFVIPWRLVRRGARKRKIEDMRHRELLDAQSVRTQEVR